ncbi:MMPL family RND transporter, partial [Mycobacteroides abscessus subsp. massiliense]
HATVVTMEDMQQVTEAMDQYVSNLDDFMRPLRNYFYWEPHCFDIPACWAFRSLFDMLDSVDKLAADIKDAVAQLEIVDKLLPQMVSQLKVMAN